MSQSHSDGIGEYFFSAEKNRSLSSVTVYKKVIRYFYQVDCIPRNASENFSCSSSDSIRSLLLALDCSCDRGTAPEADKEADWSMLHSCVTCPHAATLRHWSLRQERMVTWVMMVMWSLMSSISG